MYNQFKAIAGRHAPVRLLSAGAAVAFAAGLAGAPGAAAAQEQLVISHWGFNGDKLEEFLFAPFEEEHGSRSSSRPAKTPTASARSRSAGESRWT